MPELLVLDTVVRVGEWWPWKTHHQTQTKHDATPNSPETVQNGMKTRLPDLCTIAAHFFGKVQTRRLVTAI